MRKIVIEIIIDIGRISLVKLVKNYYSFKYIENIMYCNSNTNTKKANMLDQFYIEIFINDVLLDIKNPNIVNIYIYIYIESLYLIDRITITDNFMNNVKN